MNEKAKAILPVIGIILAPCRIAAGLGVGRMGAVRRTLDTRLDRDECGMDSSAGSSNRHSTPANRQ